MLGGLSRLAVGLAACAISALASNFEAQAQLPVCSRTVKADVVAFDQPLMFNRLGAQNVNGMIYALRSDVVDRSSGKPEAAGGTLTPGNVGLRPDKRPRPIVLRVRSGDCLEVKFTNLLSSQANPNNAMPDVMTINDQVAERRAGFTPLGMSALDSAGDTSSYVGKGPNTLAAVGQTRTYRFYADSEGSHLVLSHAASFGGEGTGGNLSNGLFGVVQVEPKQANFYRSQVTQEDMRLASMGTTPGGHPIINYEARYPTRAPWTHEGKAGKPILNMLDISGSSVNLIASDVTAVISGPNPDGSFPASTYPLEARGAANPALPNRLEPFREFIALFNDETVSKQAFPFWYEDPVFSHTLHGVGDHFMINQGAAGAGSEVIANRLGVGPAHDCLSCAYEEFFLTSFAMGDPAMLVDIPANAGLEFCSPQPGDPFCERDPTIRASYAKYPDDPANVSHSYIGDFVKFRNLHAGPKEHHIFHLHNHQWLANPNDDNANYMDAQGIGPGGSYTYEIAFGGSGNRNKSAGDAIYHCHYYPHFAQGMWALWRNHDTFEAGTQLDIPSGSDGYHRDAFALERGKPAPGARAYPDGEILAGTPIPAIIPLPGKPLPPMPGRVYVAATDKDADGQPESSQAVIDRADTNPALIDVRPVLASLNPADPNNQLNPTGLKNPGFPFWIGGMEGAVGQRAPSPPLDMAPNPGNPGQGGWDGGLPRHFLDGYAVGGITEDHQTRFSFEKHIEKAKARFISEYGNDVERAAMSFHATRYHPTFRQLLDGTVLPASYRSNGALPQPGSPFFEPCMDDEGDVFNSGMTGQFFSSAGNGLANTFTAAFGADNPRIYKAANIQLDVVFNKLGDHYPQQRIITLWDDVAPTLAKIRPPEPFVFRLNSYDCAMFYQTNLIPEFYMVDDYQVTTPTDIIGQHIHLPKWDLVSADGAANGWNYEDGVFGAETVRNRIEAINRYTLEEDTGDALLTAVAHPFFGAGPGGKYLGARTMIQRWFVDPLHNIEGRDRGLGVTFTHDHFGPSTHQQVGLYATLLVNPAGSVWKHNETGEQMYTRADGGPTSWQAIILANDIDGDGIDQTGTLNLATVDQSDNAGSALAIARNSSDINQAGNENIADVEQTNTGVGSTAMNSSSIGQNGDDASAFVVQQGTGNSSAIDQFAAGAETTFVNQNGADNIAVVDQFGTGGTVTVDQGFSGGSSEGSMANVEQSGANGEVTVMQSGNAQNATVTQAGSTNLAEIDQSGDNNIAEAAQSGAGSIVQIMQIGSVLGNSAFVAQAGSSSTFNANQTGSENVIGDAPDFLQSASSSSVGIDQNGTGNVVDGSQSGSVNSISINQIAFGQYASITQSGTGNGIDLDQNGTANSSTLIQSGTNNDIFVEQTGTTNLATITQGGLTNEAFVDQFGTGNEVLINQTGNTGLIEVLQTGADSYAEINQSGGSGNDAFVLQASDDAVSYITQVGSNNIASINQ